MITYGITVADEFFEFKRLINSLQPYLLPEEEIVILADAGKVTPEIKDYAGRCGLTVHERPFEKDFAAFKNHLFDLSSKDFLFQIDADEIIPPSLLTALRDIGRASQVDLVFVPRINVVRGATDADIKKFKWKINERGWEGFPDFQGRFCSTQGHIRWEGKVHEGLQGAKVGAALQNAPAEHYAILHVKEIEKQRSQNELYDTI